MSLRVTVTYEPGGDKTRSRVIGDIRVHNTKEELPEYSTYEAHQLTDDAGTFGVAIVNHFRADGVWELVGRVARRIGEIERAHGSAGEMR